MSKIAVKKPIESPPTGRQIHLRYEKFATFDKELAISRKWYEIDAYEK